MSRSAGRFSIYVAALVMGLGVGWLAGLSMSPVAQAVLTALLTLVAGAAGLSAAKGGASREAPDKDGAPAGANDVGTGSIHLDARGIAFVATLIFGVAAGSPLGILARTHNVFGTAGAAQQKSLAGADPKPTAAGQPSSVGTVIATGPPAPAVPPTVGGLMTSSLGGICKTLSATGDDVVMVSANGAADAMIQRIAQRSCNVVQLRYALSLVCP